MRDEETKLLFSALSRILSNQNMIRYQLGLNGYDSKYGINDEKTVKLSDACFSQRATFGMMILIMNTKYLKETMNERY